MSDREPIIAAQIVVTQMYDEDGQELITIGVPEGQEMPGMTQFVGILTRAVFAAQVHGLTGELGEDEDEDG